MRVSDRRLGRAAARGDTRFGVQRVPERCACSHFQPDWTTVACRKAHGSSHRQSTWRWVHEAQDGRLAGLLVVRAQQWLTPHRVDIQVHPAFRGAVEGSLVTRRSTPWNANRGARRSRWRRALTPSWWPPLERQGFQFHNGLTLMALEMGGSHGDS